MTFVFAVLLMLLMGMPTNAQTQNVMQQTASDGFSAADRQLNTIYRQLQRTHKTDAVFLRNLKQAQRAWIVFRDAEVALKYPNTPDAGSVTPMCRTQYLQQLTEERIAQLQKWLDGELEGDVCAGTMLGR